MKINYKRLWKLLIDKNISKSELRLSLNISPATFTKLNKNQTVNMNILLKICEYFNCEIEDIVEIDRR